MQLLSRLSTTFAVALVFAGIASAQVGIPQQPLEPATVTVTPVPIITTPALVPATSCPANVKCDGVAIDTITKYNGTIYSTLAELYTVNNTNWLTTTSLVVNVSTVIVTPVGMCEYKVTVSEPTNTTIFVKETTTYTQQYFATRTETRSTTIEYKSTTSLPCLLPETGGPQVSILSTPAASASSAASAASAAAIESASSIASAASVASVAAAAAASAAAESAAAAAGGSSDGDDDQN